MYSEGIEIVKLKYDVGVYKENPSRVYLFWVRKSVKILGIPIYGKNIKSFLTLKEASEFANSEYCFFRVIRS
jgi:hypothetical protein